MQHAPRATGLRQGCPVTHKRDIGDQILGRACDLSPEGNHRVAAGEIGRQPLARRPQDIRRAPTRQPEGAQAKRSAPSRAQKCANAARGAGDQHGWVMAHFGQHAALPVVEGQIPIV